MAEMAYLKIFRDFREVAESISSAALGHILLAALRYADDEDPGKLTTLENSIFIFLRQQIDRDKKEYQEKSEKMSEMGRKGGRPRKPVLIKACDDDEKKAAAFQKSEKKLQLFQTLKIKPQLFKKTKIKKKTKKKKKKKTTTTTTTTVTLRLRRRGLRMSMMLLFPLRGICLSQRTCITGS